MIQFLAALLLSMTSYAETRTPHFICKTGNNVCTYSCPAVPSMFSNCNLLRGSCESRNVTVHNYFAVPELPKNGRLAVLPGSPYVLYCKQVGQIRSMPSEAADQIYQRLFR